MVNKCLWLPKTKSTMCGESDVFIYNKAEHEIRYVTCPKCLKRINFYKRKS